MKQSVKEKTGEISTDNLHDDIQIFQALKPYIGHCLTMNHELNNLLSGVVGYSEFLLEEAGELTEEHRKFVEQVLSCANRISDLVEKLSDEKIELAEHIDLKSVIDSYKKITKPLD